MPTLRGNCHCGNIEVAFTTALAPEQLRLRACACSFCRRHGARTTSDPKGHVEIIVHSERELSRHRFGLRTADFLICRRCGVYVGAVIAIGGNWYATLNVNTLDSEQSLGQEAMTVSYEEESASQRVLRRQSHWTPATINVASLPPS